MVNIKMKMINSEDVKKTFMEISNNQYKQYCLLRNGDILIGRNEEKYCFVVHAVMLKDKNTNLYFCTTRLRNIAEWKQTIIIYVTRSIIIRYILKITRRYCCKY